MNESHTIDASPVLAHFQTLMAYGIPCQTLEKALGLPFDALCARDARVPFLNNLKMIEKGMALIGPEIPLKLGQEISIEKIGVCGHLFNNCETLDETIRQFLRYQRLLYSVSSFKAVRKNQVIIFNHVVRLPQYRLYNQIIVELAFSSIVAILKKQLGNIQLINELRFSFDRPSHFNYYKEVFPGPLKFKQNEDAIIIDTRQLNQAIPQSQGYIKELLAEHADGLLKQIQESDQFKDKVKKVVLNNLHKGTVNIEMVSENLNMSRWTLNRYLKKEGTTFKQLLNLIRTELSLEYLKNKDLSITEITFLLGYSEASAFTRAFKNWTGKNPSDQNRDCFI